ncbi:MAG TPA: hypothetical protein ENI07_23735 [Desulfobacterales bacterium]|nr:hypothetical protein [Desulfobacterales bacterium]
MEQSPVDQFNQASGGTRKWFGIGLLFLSVLGFTASILAANRALKDGIDVHTINALRYSMTIVLLFLFQKIRGKQLKLPKRERYTGMALGIAVFMTGVGYLSATKYLPISLAVLIFYTAPFFVAIISRFTENEPITIIRLIAIVIAFIGIALALGIQTEATLNWQGVAFALLAAFGYTGLVSVSSLTMKTVNPQAVNFHCLASGSVLFVVFLLFTGGAETTISQSSWLKLGFSSISLTVGFMTFFTGLEIVGPVKTSMLMNMEPILTIILATIMLGERLSPVQWIGAGLVVVGILLITGRFKKENN